MADRSEKSVFAKIMSWVIPGAVAVVCFWWGYKQATKGPSDPILKEQLTPEGALKVYAENAYNFMTMDIDFNFIRKVILKDDWEWFQDNYKSFHEDAFNLSKGLHPMEGEAVAKVLVMRQILSAGPSRKDCEIINVNTSGNRSEVTVRQLVQQGTLVEMKVEVIKEGKYWKMKDFGGGRQMIQNEKSPLGNRKNIIMDASGGERNDPVTGMYGSAGTHNTAQPTQLPAQPTPNQDLALLMMGAPSPTPASIMTQDQLHPGADPIAQIDALINQANQYWQTNRYQDALSKATQALDICKKNLGENHPKTSQVQAMVDAAKKQLGQ